MNNNDVIARMLEQTRDIIKHETIRTLSYLGEQCVAMARDRDAESSWIDHTGNLRSSIGFGVVANGQLENSSDFKTVLEGTEGAEKGKALVQQIAAESTDPYLLTIVAGMDYASYVEAKENKDVLASTELWARDKLPAYLDKTKQRISKQLAKL